MLCVPLNSNKKSYFGSPTLPLKWAIGSGHFSMLHANCQSRSLLFIYICLTFQLFYNYFSCVWLRVFLVCLLEYFANQDCLLVPSVGLAVTFCWERLGREAESAVGRLVLGSLTLPRFQRELCKLVSWLVLHMVAYNGHCILFFVPRVAYCTSCCYIFSYQCSTLWLDICMFCSSVVCCVCIWHGLKQ